MKKRSIITGGAGFIGSNLTDHLVRIGHKVIVLDNFVSGKKSNLSHHKKQDVKIIKIDISKSKNLDKYFKGVHYVFHFAALSQIIPSIKNPKKYFKNNVIGTLKVVEAAKKAKIKKLENEKDLEELQNDVENSVVKIVEVFKRSEKF